ncbi:MAG: TetR family transcriptional regulator [Anaerolineae bacterium]|nr:TetR family transcriptional regulator [Anaerolineae bacterium]
MRRTIIDTALELLSQQGLEGLSLREIARQIDYTPAALYEYFASKEALLSALVIEADRMLTEEMEKTIQHCETDQKLLEVGMVYINFAERNPQLYQLFINAPAPRLEQAQPLDENGGTSFRLLAEILKETCLQNANDYSNGLNLEEITFSCWALVHGIASLQRQATRAMFAEPQLVYRKIISLFIKNLINQKA